METERAYLVKIGHYWIDLSKIEYLEPGYCLDSTNTVHMDSGKRILLNSDDLKALTEKLDAWHLLAS